MITARAVIGANYGDEGKGLMTDYFASLSENPESCLIVRYNGGAQAGHTVTTPDDRRHVFSHFGAGSFVGSPTYLSQFFIVNPLVFVKELAELRSLNVAPQIIIDCNAMLTTPIDVFINQLVETRRGSNRHGSCGLGINETVTRCLRSPETQTRVRDIIRPQELEAKIRTLYANWLPQRLNYLGINSASPEWSAIEDFGNSLENILARYLADTGQLLENIVLASKCPQFESIIFEGAQGLMLDEDRFDQWPHLTRSKTGLANIVHLANKMQVDHLDITYVTRSYLTRHGAGPLERAQNWSFNDATNVPNPYQGTLRFAELNWRNVQNSINQDLLASAHHLRGTHSVGLAVTCLDQHPMPITTIDVPIHYRSTGPTRQDVGVSSRFNPGQEGRGKPSTLIHA